MIERDRALTHSAQLVHPGLASGSQPGAALGASGRRSLFRNFGVQFIRRSVAGSSERAYPSGFRSWSTFRGLTEQELYLRPSESKQGKVWALVDYASWCTASNGNQAGAIPSKLAAIQYFHRADVSVELPIRSPLIKRMLQGISRSHTLTGTRPPAGVPPYIMRYVDCGKGPYTY